MIELKHVTKKYGLNTAVSDLSVRIEDGEIVGFLGPNGAGKSTTMNMMTGYISTSSGSIEINGYDILKDAEKAKKLIGYLPEIPPLYMDMTVMEYLSFVYELKKVSFDKEKHLEDIISKVKIKNVKDRIIKNLSKGYKQRVGIAQALIGDPEVLILDEPTVGLDPNQIQDMRTLIRDLGKSRTVIISSHILSEITSVCTKVLIINHGKLIVYDTIKNINDKLLNHSTFVVKIRGSRDMTLNVLKGLEFVDSVKVDKTDEKDVYVYTVTPIEGKDIRKSLLDVIDKSNLTLLSFDNKKLTLEDIFLKVTGVKKKGVK